MVLEPDSYNVTGAEWRHPCLHSSQDIFSNLYEGFLSESVALLYLTSCAVEAGMPPLQQ